MENKLNTFEDLKCWQECKKLRIFVARKVVPILPNEERYRVADQILRAARSATANIAEGYGRFHYMDNAKFCSNSRGSFWEVLDHLITAYDEGLIPREMLQEGREIVNSAIKMINGYMNYLRRAAKTTKVNESIAIYQPKISDPVPDNR